MLKICETCHTMKDLKGKNTICKRCRDEKSKLSFNATPKLNCKESEKFLKKMLKTQKGKISKVDKRILEKIQENQKYFKIQKISGETKCQ